MSENPIPQKLHALDVLIIYTAAILTVSPGLGATEVLSPAGPMERLCTFKQSGSQGVTAGTDIRCRLETGRFAVNPQAPPAGQTGREIKVVAYNVHHGIEYNEIVDFLRSDKSFGSADIILLSEVARGCPLTGNRSMARDLARELRMNFAFAVEFAEVPTGTGVAPVPDCELGNAILTRFPIKSAEQVRHQSSDRPIPRSEFQTPKHSRFGGRIMLAADLVISNSIVRVYSLHFSSGTGDNRLRAQQAREVVGRVREYSGPVIAGGDLNVGLYWFDLLGNSSLDKTPPVFFKAGFQDAHAGLSLSRRVTTRPQKGVRLLLDLILVKGLSVLDRSVCRPQQCDPLSDHLPIQAKVLLPE